MADSGGTGLASTNVQVMEIVRNDMVDLQGNLLPGLLMQWMDAAACMSAERHARQDCVTACMDDLSFEVSVSVGTVVYIRAIVNCAFRTSMEVGVEVTAENPVGDGTAETVCNGYFTFVALNDQGKASPLGPLIAASEAERHQSELAQERKTMRIQRKSYVDAGAEVSEQVFQAVLNEPTSIPASSTKCFSSYLVLPNHANHHGNTFGGQIMTWMSGMATMIGSKLLRVPTCIVSVDDIFFIAPSSVGDRIVVRACVNRCFDDHVNIEVGLAVHAIDVAGNSRKINKAFFTLKGSVPVPHMPLVVPSDEHSLRRYHKALGRQRVRLSRKAMRHGLAKEWVPEELNTLSMENVSGLLNSSGGAGHFKWRQVGSEHGCKMSIRESGTGAMCLKIEFQLPSFVSDVYAVLRDCKLRSKWDPAMVDLEILEDLGGDNQIHYMAMQGVKGVHDFVLLRSCREFETIDGFMNRSYLVASTSLICEDKWPAREGRVRSEVVSSGFILECADWEPESLTSPTSSPSSPVGTNVTYIAQLSPTAIGLLIPQGVAPGIGALESYIRLSTAMACGLREYMVEWEKEKV